MFHLVNPSQPLHGSFSGDASRGTVERSVSAQRDQPHKRTRGAPSPSARSLILCPRDTNERRIAEAQHVAGLEQIFACHAIGHHPHQSAVARQRDAAQSPRVTSALKTFCCPG